MVPPSGPAGVGVMGPPHMGPHNQQVYDFPTAGTEEEGGSKGKKKPRERKKPAVKEPKAAKSPKTPKGAKGKNAAQAAIGWFFV